jgi:hypothetical protein
MLDSKRYYSVFPDENPQRLRGLLDALDKLEKEFRLHIEQFRIETDKSAGIDKP